MEDKNKPSWTEQVKEVWEEVIFKKKLVNIEQKLNEVEQKMEENQDKIRNMVKEEVTKVWNESTAPTLKLILEKLNLLTIDIEKGKEKVIEEIEEEPETSVKRQLKNAIILKKNSKKSLYTPAENKMLDKLAKLHKQGKI